MTRINNRQWVIFGWFLVSSLIFSAILLGPYGVLFRDLIWRVVILGGFVGISVVILKKTWAAYRLWPAFMITLIVYGVIYQIATFLPGINNSPFTLTWSEGSAYYFASAYFSKQIYGISIDLPLINPTRHLLMAIPFIIPELPIWLHRSWEVFLWLMVTGLTIFLLVRRLDITNRLLRWTVIGWVFLYFYQGPVYYFLLISIIPILWGFNAKNFTKTLLLVLVGSVWAGLSRVNWMPVPALLAAAFYFLEVRVDQRGWVRYLLTPLIWFVSGVAVALLVWIGYAQWSGQPPGNFGVYFTSHLLWYRLLPNATYPGGVLLMTLLASLPLFGVIAIQLYRSGFNYHIIRHLGIGIILLVLFIGGLIVSAKIGGGNNIHNLDAFLLILLVTGVYLYFGKAVPDSNFPEREPFKKLTNIFITFAVIIPLLLTVDQGRPRILPEESRIDNALLTIQEYADEAAADDGKVLFLAERQLLTFGEIEDIPLVPEYERMKLMEMVMGDNTSYLAKFRQRIENQEYALIISEPLDDKFKGRSVPFGDENDVYVAQVSRPVLCYYEPVKDVFKFPIQLLVPRSPEDICS
ncbi:MAG: hypothetical protein ACK2UE_05270 [Anaerolineales bacterium]|jgi:hypothetical protein